MIISPQKILRWENLVAIDSLHRLRYFKHHATRIGYLHDGVILLLQPKSFSFFLSNLNLEIRSQQGFKYFLIHPFFFAHSNIARPHVSGITLSSSASL